MTSMSLDLDVLKEIPGYRAILKTVVKSLIQILLEQLSEHTSEESLILTASVNDGSLSHLGSSLGKGFLDGREEIKSQFLGYCLTAQHRQLSASTQAQQKQQQGQFLNNSVSGPVPGNGSTQKRPKPYERPSFSKGIPALNLKQHGKSGVRGYSGEYFVGNNSGSPSYSENRDLNTSMPVFPAQTQTFDGDDSGGVPPYVTVKTEIPDNTETETLDLGASIKLEAASDSDIELTGVEEASNGALDYSLVPGYGLPPGHMQNYGNLSNLNTSNSDFEGSFDNHLDNNSKGDKDFKCMQCSKEFKTKQNLSRHLRIHTGDKPYSCPYCEKCFRMKHHVHSHIASCHAAYLTEVLGMEVKM